MNFNVISTAFYLHVAENTSGIMANQVVSHHGAKGLSGSCCSVRRWLKQSIACRPTHQVNQKQPHLAWRLKPVPLLLCRMTKTHQQVSGEFFFSIGLDLIWKGTAPPGKLKIKLSLQLVKHHWQERMTSGPLFCCLCLCFGSSRAPGAPLPSDPAQ